MRLDKLLAQSAGLSRSQARELIRAGRLLVDGQVEARAEARVRDTAALTLDGQPLRALRAMHLMMNKPAGLLTAARDARAGTVMDLLPPQAAALGCMPVGRLDRDTEGLLLFTSDGELAHRLLSPRRKVGKLYEARVSGQLGQAAVDAFARGIQLADFTARPALLQVLEAREDTSLARVELTEGKHRQVRRMFQNQGHEVLRLTRLRIGPLALDPGLETGAWRELSKEELRALREAVALA